MRKTKIILAMVSIILTLQPGPGLRAQKTTNGKSIVHLLHGLGRSKTAMWLLADRLEDAGFTVHRVDYSSLTQSQQEIQQEIAAQISAADSGHFASVHFVGHSLGGLLIRAYLEKYRVPNLGRVVLLGTPNKGTPLVDHYRDSWWMQLLGPTTLSLGTDKNSFPNSIADPYYPVGVIAGVAETIDNEDILPGQDDGLVPLESTKLDGMADMIVIESNHSMMRYDEDVAQQTLSFLRHGKFLRKGQQMDFIDYSVKWLHGEILQARLLALFGLILIIIAVLFRFLGHSPFAKDMILPVVLLGVFCFGAGLGLNFSNKKRVPKFQAAYERDAGQFIASEKARTEKFIVWYPITRYAMAGLIVVGLALVLFLPPPAKWRAWGLMLILLGFVALFLDHFSEERASAYHREIIISNGTSTAG